MATWPATGVTDWNAKMLAYLAVEHNTDGTHDMHDAEGGYAQVDVNDVKTNVYTKYFTGTLGAGSPTNVAHGITGIDKILFVGVVVFSTNTSNYLTAEVGGGSSAVNRFTPRFDGTNVIIESVGSAMQSQKYRIRIDYIL